MAANEVFNTIDWFDFKTNLKRAYFNDDYSWLKLSGNQRHARQWLSGSAWSGFTNNQVKRWLTDGFPVQGISGLTAPTVREKRRILYSEEGDEMNVDIVLSGGENYMSQFSKRESIPGCSIEAGIMFSGGVSERTVCAYSTWICEMAYSLQSSGVDCQITLDFPSWNLADTGYRASAGTGTLFHNIVRVKKENEASDFLSWSPMLSPAALRGFGFTLGVIHTDNIGKVCSGSFGRGVPERREWKVKYDSARRTIVVENCYMHGGGDFPASRMTAQFKDALKEMQKG